jgi:hypothetical protein
MKNKQLMLLALTVALKFCATAFAQKTEKLDKYKSRTLAEIPALNREATDAILRQAKIDEKHGFISYDPFYARVKVEYAGQRRPLTPVHLELMKTWSKLQNVGKKTVSLYENEFLFKEGAKEYWIPVQKKVEEGILKELKANDMITLFVVHVGGSKAAMAKDFEWLFLSNSFEK